MTHSIHNFLVIDKNGIYCPAGNFYLDPLKPVSSAIITHAHADHAVPGNSIVYCTQATADLMMHRYKTKAASTFKIVKPNCPIKINDVEISVLPAGHILGSVQVLMTHSGIKYLFTGDFKLQKDNTCAEFEFTDADVLITETTFANPAVSHTSGEMEILKINSLEEKNTVIGSYALGKAQRLSKLINDHCPGKMIFIHRDIIPFHRIYEEHGIQVGNWQPYSTQRFRLTKHGVYIVPPRVFSGYRHHSKYYTAFATGWTSHPQNGNINLHISDHADWNDVLTVVNRTKPKLILTMHGDGKFMREYFSKSGIEVRMLN